MTPHKDLYGVDDGTPATFSPKIATCSPYYREYHHHAGGLVPHSRSVGTGSGYCSVSPTILHIVAGMYRSRCGMGLQGFSHQRLGPLVC